MSPDSKLYRVAIQKVKGGEIKVNDIREADETQLLPFIYRVNEIKGVADVAFISIIEIRMDGSEVQHTLIGSNKGAWPPCSRIIRSTATMARKATDKKPEEKLNERIKEAMDRHNGRPVITALADSVSGAINKAIDLIKWDETPSKFKRKEIKVA